MAADTTDTDWDAELDADEYRVLRECGTEPKFSSDLLNVEAEGVFRCAGCGQELFTTDEKFESGTGWPSFRDVADKDAVETRTDESHRMERSGFPTEKDDQAAPKAMRRTEVVCSSCGGHLGHVFDDSMKSEDFTRSTETEGSGSGPEPTGKRYCINGVALDFDPEADVGGD